MNRSILGKALGLSEPETRVFLAVSALGQASVQQIARKSGVKRTTIYNFLHSLLERRLLVETTKGRRSVYSAIHPGKLREELRSDFQALDQELERLAEIQESARKRPRVTYFDGLEGIRELYEDTLRERQPIVAWTDYEPLFSVMGRYLKGYAKKRAERGISFRSIVRDSKRSRDVIRRNAAELRRTKLIGCSEFRTEINVYGEKVAIMSFRKSSPLAVLIEDRELAGTMRVIWQELWDRIEGDESPET